VREPARRARTVSAALSHRAGRVLRWNTVASMLACCVVQQASFIVYLLPCIVNQVQVMALTETMRPHSRVMWMAYFCAFSARRRPNGSGEPPTHNIFDLTDRVVRWSVPPGY
jgi:hypothetical protein